MRAILVLKQRGVVAHMGNLILNDIFGAEVRFVEKRSFRERRVGDQCVMTSLRSMMRSCVMDL